MTWDRAQYNRFSAEREQPFWDLVALIEAIPDPTVVDLGCGDGRLTAALHSRLGASSTVGVDSSPEMLAGAEAHRRADVSFEQGDLAAWSGRADIVFANASLQWVPDHETVISCWTKSLEVGGQLAVQVPANADHPSHVVAQQLAAEWIGEAAPPDPVAENVLRPERYAEILHRLGFERQSVRLQVYGHRLDTTADVVEWVKGTSLTRFKSVLSEGELGRFIDEYRTRLLAELGQQQPYFYPFKRILMWGRLS